MRMRVHTCVCLCGCVCVCLCVRVHCSGRDRVLDAPGFGEDPLRPKSSFAFSRDPGFSQFITITLQFCIERLSLF